MLPASAFQETRIFVQGVSKSLEMFNTILQNLNSSIGCKILVCWVASGSSITEGMSEICYCGTDSSVVHDTLQPYMIDAMGKLLD